MVEGIRRTRRKRAYIGAGLALAAVVTTGAVVLASVPHSFTAGETLTAANLNSNFARSISGSRRSRRGSPGQRRRVRRSQRNGRGRRGRGAPQWLAAV